MIRARGDAATALALQREADFLRASLHAASQAFNSSHAAGKRNSVVEPVKFDTKMIAVQWASLQADQVRVSGKACVLDCGTRGSVTVTPTGIALTGSLKADPNAIMLLVRHAQLNWDSKLIVHGSDEFKLNTGVASKMLGVKVLRGRIPRSQRAEADALANKWRSTLDLALFGNAPTRPRAPLPSTTGPVIASAPT